jgi:hypothetical protein
MIVSPEAAGWTKGQNCQESKTTSNRAEALAKADDCEVRLRTERNDGHVSGQMTGKTRAQRANRQTGSGQLTGLGFQIAD